MSTAASRVLLSPDIYAPGKRITWQAFSSSTKKQTATLDFVNVLPGRKLSGSLFVIDSITAKDIRHFSAIPSEEEVLFPPNSQFKVEKVVSSGSEKKGLLKTKDKIGASTVLCPRGCPQEGRRVVAYSIPFPLKGTSAPGRCPCR